MLIKLLHGTYGTREDGIIVTKTNKSTPFHVEEKRGRKLIASGYAQEVNDADRTHESNQEYVGESGKSLGDVISVDNYSIQDLRKIASRIGLSASGSKKELFGRIDAYSKSRGNLTGEEPDKETEGGDSEESLLLKAAEPEA